MVIGVDPAFAMIICEGTPSAELALPRTRPAKSISPGLSFKNGVELTWLPVKLTGYELTYFATALFVKTVSTPVLIPGVTIPYDALA